MFKKYIRKIIAEELSVFPHLPLPYVMLDDETKDTMKHQHRKDIDFAVKREFEYEINVEIKNVASDAVLGMIEAYEDKINDDEMIAEIIRRINSLQLEK